jgi:hypothetical protein
MGEENVVDGAVQVQPTPGEKPARQPRQPKRPVASVGRTVHYTTDSGRPRPAVITEVHDDDFVDLVIFNSLGAVPVEDIEFSEEPTSGCWSWPPRD